MRVTWSKRAVADLRKITHYIGTDMKSFYQEPVFCRIGIHYPWVLEESHDRSNRIGIHCLVYS